MTKKHFVKIAATIRYFVENPQPLVADKLAKALAGEFKQINPNFDRVKFLKACGVGE
jgi:hypothetical protein